MTADKITPTSVGEDFPHQQERLLKLIEQYREIGPVGAFGLAMIQGTLREANEAAISGDIVRIVRAYASMKECQ
jgi:hypothetical protein